MSILTYALHYQGEFNKNSLGAVSEASKLAGQIGGERGEHCRSCRRDFFAFLVVLTAH